MILRRWSGRIRTADREAYLAYVEETGVSGYLETPGCLGCQLLARDLDDGVTEVTTLSWWRGMEDIVAFAGEPADRARYYPEDDQYLVSRQEFVEHHEVAVDARAA